MKTSVFVLFLFISMMPVFGSYAISDDALLFSPEFSAGEIPAAQVPPVAPVEEKQVAESQENSPPEITPEPAPEIVNAVPEDVEAEEPADDIFAVLSKIDTETVSQVSENESLAKNIIETSDINESDSAFMKRLSGNRETIPLDILAGVSPDIQEAIQIDEAVALALKNNFEVMASDQAVKSGFWDKIGTYGQYGPTLNLTLSKGRERSRPASINDINGDRVKDDRHARRDRDLVVRQPLIDLGIVAEILSSTDKEEIQKIDNRATRETVALDTVNAFYNIVQARVAVHLADQYKKYLEDIAARMSARVEEGGAPAADLDRISARALLAESARIQAVGEYETGLSEFQRLTGVIPLEIKIPEILAPQVPREVTEALDGAYQANPSYLSSLKKIELAKVDAAKFGVEMLPEISGQYTSTYVYNAGGSAKGNPIDGVYPSQRSDSMLLVAKWELHPTTSVPGGLSGLAKIREMDYLARDVKTRIQQGVKASYTALGAAEKRKEALRESVLANQRVVDSFEVQYQEGGRPLFDLLDAYEQLYNSQLNLMRVVMANVRASYQVRKQMGDLIPSVIQTSGN
jgi:adhesin transport system outer membrane protein